MRDTAGLGAVADASAGDGHVQMRLAAARSAEKNEIALALQERAGGQIPDQGFVHRAGREVEVTKFLGQRPLGDGYLVLI